MLLHAGRGRDAAGLVRGVRASTLRCCSAVVARLAGAADLPRSSGWSSRCRSCSSRCCCRSSPPGPQRRGPRAQRLASPGCWRRGALLAKGTLGVLAASTLAATTEPRELLAGLERLRLPQLLVQIMGFMVRYLDVVTDRDAAGCRSPASPAASRPANPAALAGAGAGPPARCSSAPTSAASGSTSRCSRAATPAGMPETVSSHVGTPVLDVRGLAFAYPDGHQALFGVDLHVAPRRAGRAARPERRRQDHARAAPQRHPRRRRRARVDGRRAAGRQGEPRRGPAPGRHRLPGPRRPAVHAARSATTSRSARPTSGSGAPSSTRG